MTAWLSSRPLALFGIIVCSTVGVSMAAGLTPSTSLIAPAARKPAPGFSSKDATGGVVTLSRYRGRVVLLDFWATWCTGCKREIPWYVDFQKRYGSKGLRAIGVAMDDEGWQKVRPYLREHRIGYPIVLANRTLATSYKIANMPVTVLIDRQGRIADLHVGVVDKDAWEQEIQELLGEQIPHAQ